MFFLFNSKKQQTPRAPFSYPVKKYIFFVITIAILKGCILPYRPNYPRLSAVPPSSPLIIDGDWKMPKGAVLRIEKGRAYAIDFANAKKESILGKNIRKVSEGKYEMEWISWNSTKRISDFGPASLKIANSTQLIMQYAANTKTDLKKGEFRLTNIRFDDGFSYIKDWENLMGANVVASKIMKAYRRFLNKSPESQYAATARAKIKAFSKKAWEETHKLDKVYAYEKYLRLYPDSEYSQKGKDRLEWQKANRANEYLMYPKIVSATHEYFDPIYKWTTVFKETGGNAGFKLKATDFYIRDPSGGRWSNSWSRGVEVKPNGRASVDYWCDTSDKWDGGYFHAIWVGEDDWGNKISIVQEVHLAK